MKLRRPRLSDVLLAGACVLLALAVAFVAVSVLNLAQHANRQDRELDQAHAARSRLAGRLDAQARALRKANARLVRAGKEPVTPTPGATGATGATGPMGPRGYSCIQLLGVAACRGPQGPSGDTGPQGATGPAGAAGATGDTGAKGDPGPAGPKGDTGPQGPAGPAGADGKDGSVTPGTYGCPDGQVMTGVVVAADGSMTVQCATAVLPGGKQ